jgi:phosphatidylglycerol:prolipoprotein diacylglycerol transferase
MFPNLTIGPISLPIPEFSLLIGFWIGAILAGRAAKKSGLDHQLIDNLIWLILISGLLGARVSYLARNFSAFQGNLKAILSLNPALMDPSGGFLVAITSVYIFLSKKQISYLKVIDSLVFFISPLLISLNLARFASGNAYGLPTNLPWGINLWAEIRHPVQLYLGASGLIILIISMLIYQQKYHLPGYTFFLFSSLTSGAYLFFSRFITAKSYLPGGYRLYQIVFWLLLAISLGLWIQLERSLKQETANGS